MRAVAWVAGLVVAWVAESAAGLVLVLAVETAAALVLALVPVPAAAQAVGFGKCMECFSASHRSTQHRHMPHYSPTVPNCRHRSSRCIVGSSPRLNPSLPMHCPLNLYDSLATAWPHLNSIPIQLGCHEDSNRRSLDETKV